MSTPLIVPMPWGRVELDTNEVSIISTQPDPPALRFAVAEGGSLGKLSFNRLRPDGRQEECVLLQGKIDERAPDSLSGELTLHIRRDEPGLSDDASMRRIVTFRNDQILLGPGIALLTETT